MNESEEFLKLYNNLEFLIKKKYGYYESPILNASTKELKKFKKELDTLRNIRNILSHSKPFGTDYCITPHKNTLRILKRITEEVDDELLIKKCTKLENIIYADIDDTILDFMNKMENHIYSHAPILENGYVKGVFSEGIIFSTLIKYKNNDEIIPITKDLKFRTVINTFKLDNHYKEEYLFMASNDRMDQALEKYKELYLNENRRIGMIFITKNGKANEPLLGIITASDILGKNELFYI